MNYLRGLGWGISFSAPNFPQFRKRQIMTSYALFSSSSVNSLMRDGLKIDKKKGGRPRSPTQRSFTKLN